MSNNTKIVKIVRPMAYQ